MFPSNSSKQMEVVTLDDLVSDNHIYRKFLKLWDLSEIKMELEKIEIESDHKGYGIFRLFLCLLVQFMEDLSDRELEEAIRSNNSFKWFCGFGLTEKTPNHTVFTGARKRIGTNKLSKIFNILRSQLKKQGYMNEVFTFIDASHLISKSTLWKEIKKLRKNMIN